jgi:hypothetical protein
MGKVCEKFGDTEYCESFESADDLPAEGAFLWGAHDAGEILRAASTLTPRFKCFLPLYLYLADQICLRSAGWSC